VANPVGGGKERERKVRGKEEKGSIIIKGEQRWGTDWEEDKKEW